MNLISPCVALCKLTEGDICIGCKRTIEEIINWRTYTDNQKKAVFTRLENLEKEAATQSQPRKQAKCELLSRTFYVWTDTQAFLFVKNQKPASLPHEVKCLEKVSCGQTLTKFKQLQFKTTLNAP